MSTNTDDIAGDAKTLRGRGETPEIDEGATLPVIEANAISSCDIPFEHVEEIKRHSCSHNGHRGAAFGSGRRRPIDAGCQSRELLPRTHDVVLRGDGSGAERIELRAFDESFSYLFNSYYESLGERHPRPQRGLITCSHRIRCFQPIAQLRSD
jgi:hypothetical protein